MELLIPKEWSTIKKLLAEFLARGGGANLIRKTETGNPATFETNIVRMLQSIQIPLSYSQAGSGDPAPDNVREITGVTSVTVSASGEDTSDPETYVVTLDDAVYGGKLDAAKGVLTLSMMGVTFDGTQAWESGTKSGGYARFHKLMPNMAYGSGRSDVVACNWMNPAENGATLTASTPPETITGNRPNPRIYLKTAVADTVTAFRDYLSEHPLQVVYKLAEPVVLKVDPVKIPTISGVNNVWTDTTGDNTIKYLYKNS